VQQSGGETWNGGPGTTGPPAGDGPAYHHVFNSAVTSPKSHQDTKNRRRIRSIYCWSSDSHKYCTMICSQDNTKTRLGRNWVFQQAKTDSLSLTKDIKQTFFVPSEASLFNTIRKCVTFQYNVCYHKTTCAGTPHEGGQSVTSHNFAHELLCAQRRSAPSSGNGLGASAAITLVAGDVWRILTPVRSATRSANCRWRRWWSRPRTRAHRWERRGNGARPARRKSPRRRRRPGSRCSPRCCYRCFGFLALREQKTQP